MIVPPMRKYLKCQRAILWVYMTRCFSDLSTWPQPLLITRSSSGRWMATQSHRSPRTLLFRHLKKRKRLKFTVRSSVSTLLQAELLVQSTCMETYSAGTHFREILLSNDVQVPKV